ncbi:MAG: hypothetical protein ACYSUN_08340 [Planctomycetota bacterium]|jgi:hypothetical protein
MHRSVLKNPAYGKFAAQHTVEVITMEELDIAVAKESRNISTYKEKDPWGEEQHYLIEFPGLTLDDLRDLSNSDALNYMQGNRIPYTAIVDPHNLAELEGLRGVKTAKELMEAITRHRKALLLQYGKGIERKVWKGIENRLVQIDIHLGKGEISEAMQLFRKMESESARKPEVLKKKVRLALEVILDDAGLRLDTIERTMVEGKGKSPKAELTKLKSALKETPLAERVDALLKKA